MLMYSINKVHQALSNLPLYTPHPPLKNLRLTQYGTLRETLTLFDNMQWRW